MEPKKINSEDISESTSAINLNGTYDVILSFKREDTGKGFVSHLYKDLVEKGIHTLLDDETLECCRKSLRQDIDKAFDDSKIAIIVFSETYGNSSWCLKELVKIVKSNPKKVIVPVFYDIDPSNVRKQGETKETKEAFLEAANIAGWNVPTTDSGNESECIRRIVSFVHHELKHRIPTNLDDLVGMEFRVNNVIQLLRMEESDNVLTVGILGVGGIGKTTTARAIFDKISHYYDGGSCFLKIDSGKHAEKDLIKLQKTLLSRILADDIDISDTDEGVDMIRTRLQYKKVLIVLDNVDHREHLNALATEDICFGDGSRVIITTRNKRLLDEADAVYELERLNDSEAMELFYRNAFRKNKPHEDFVDLCHQFVQYAEGLPLAIRVLGSHLKGLNKEEWTSEIRKLQKIHHKDVLSVLKMSYGLQDGN